MRTACLQKWLTGYGTGTRRRQASLLYSGQSCRTRLGFNALVHCHNLEIINNFIFDLNFCKWSRWNSGACSRRWLIWSHLLLFPQDGFSTTCSPPRSPVPVSYPAPHPYTVTSATFHPQQRPRQVGMPITSRVGQGELSVLLVPTDYTTTDQAGCWQKVIS